MALFRRERRGRHAARPRGIHRAGAFLPACCASGSARTCRRRTRSPSSATRFCPTTKLPLAIDFLRTEVLHGGRLNPAMAKIGHYFTPFQTFVVAAGRVGQVEVRHGDRAVNPRADGGVPGAGAFAGGAVHLPVRVRGAEPAGLRRRPAGRRRRPLFRTPRGGPGSPAWRGRWGRRTSPTWSISAATSSSRAAAGPNTTPTGGPATRCCSTARLGRIARANRGKDPLYMFAALQRQLGYPRVPKPAAPADDKLPPAQEARLARLEKRLQLLEAEQRGTGIDLHEFHAPRPESAGLDLDEPPRAQRARRSRASRRNDASRGRLRSSSLSRVSPRCDRVPSSPLGALRALCGSLFPIEGPPLETRTLRRDVRPGALRASAARGALPRGT